ncbi:hypothetical protein FOA52_001267 [Chlamydomonas sp. UWO 241]|nr:hypothetical protein FOA52_001267 [Chlamydomonas sp. UWO 241]
MTATQTTYAAFKSLVTLPLLMLVMCGLVSGQDGDGWRTGRATWYDDDPSMSVHDGSCMYGYLGGRYGGEGNWHVGAINDGNPLFSGSCGKCFEVKCEPMNFKDNYGQELGRKGACSSTSSINVAITDNCPCHKPGNEYSNQRWCCGDMDHLDVGIWAFRDMADPGLGVIGIKYRPVDCPSGWEDAGCKHPHDPGCLGDFLGQPSAGSSSSSGGEYSSPSPEDWSPNPDDAYSSSSPEEWSPSPDDWSPSPNDWTPSPEDWSPSPEDWTPSPEDWSPDDWNNSPSPENAYGSGPDDTSNGNGDGSSGYDNGNQDSYGNSPW